MMVLAGCNHSTEENIGGSQTNLEDDDKTVNNNIDIYDFYFVNRAPKAKGKNELDEVIKFYFSTTSPISTSIAIDIKKKGIYKDPRSSTNGVILLEEPVKFDDKATLLNILNKHNVQGWKEDFTTDEPDNYVDGDGWYLIIQFEDGTIEEHWGQGTTDKIFPKGV